MKKRSAASCPRCAHLQQRVRQLEAVVEQLQKQLAAAKKDSSTSSKPPSSDIVKPPKPAVDPNQPQRGIGGQPEHPAHFRTPFTPEQVTETIPHRLSHCPDCGGLLTETAEPP